MFAVTYARYGDPSVLEVSQEPEPHAGPGQVRISTRAVGVNPFDWKVRAGYMKDMMSVPFPMIPGGEAAGVVDEIGDGVEGVQLGTEVFGLGSAATAEFAVLDHFAVKPTGLTWAQAAAMAAGAETARRCLKIIAPSAGQTLLIDGAAGTVGSAAVQFAIADGIRVIGTASSSNQDFLRSLGATPTGYGPMLPERIAELTADGIDAAIDTAGKGSVPELIALTGNPGKVVSIADFSASQLGAHVTSDTSAYEALDEAAALAQAGKYQVRIDSQFPFAEAAKAHERSQGGHVNGKVILEP